MDDDLMGMHESLGITRLLKLGLIFAFGLVYMSCSSQTERVVKEDRLSAEEINVLIGGQKVVSLSQPQSADSSKPQILGAEILPGRGMNMYQLKAYVPSKGVVNLFESPSLETAREQMNGGSDDFDGNMSFKIGGAILVPFANRIRGKLLPDGKTLETNILGKTVKLPANWKGKNPHAEPHAMHGLILATPMSSITTQADAGQASVTGILDAGDFQGHWLSKANVTVTATLKKDSFGFVVTVKNLGDEQMPVGVGWHPYFHFPSGDREQARLYIPAKQRALVNNYDDVFPTGKLVPIAGTPYDFSVPGGAPLKRLFLDDCFVDLQRQDQQPAVTEIIDPAAHYGLRIKSLSPQITAFQAYAPVDKPFVAFEPQFNWADPFSTIWKGKNTRMVILKPGESVSYSVQLELFVP